jgi:cytochrome c553
VAAVRKERFSYWRQKADMEKVASPWFSIALSRLPGALVLLGLSFGGWVLAAGAGWSQSIDPGSRGQLVASGGGPGGPRAACFTCHGVDGSGQAASGFPRLAGLDARYLAKQLDDYASATRQDEIMAPIARQLGRDDREAVARYYAGLSLTVGATAARSGDPALLQEGAVLYAIGSSRRHLQACANCHGPAGRGLGASFPALAGQPATYTAEQLRRWQTGGRANDVGAVMAQVAKGMAERDIEAAAAYLSSLRLPLK